MCLCIYLNLSVCLCIYLNGCLCLIAAIPQKLVRRHNTGLTNSNVYLNMTTSIFKENQVPSAHLSKAMTKNTFVTTKYSTPSQVVTLVMPFPKLPLFPL